VADSSFSKTSRLLTAADFKAVFTKAQLKVSCRYFLMLAIKNNSSKPRLGLVIAKKNVPKAVHRNRIKRLMRESFRLNPGLVERLDLVVLARKDADKLDNSLIRAKLEKLITDISNKLKSGDN
jgi:ribonuclease P protein component